MSPAKLVRRGSAQFYKRSWRKKGIKGYSKYSSKRDSKVRGHKFVKHGERSRGSKHYQNYKHTGDLLGEKV
jgi:hypothetical protein